MDDLYSTIISIAIIVVITIFQSLFRKKEKKANDGEVLTSPFPNIDTDDIEDGYRMEDVETNNQEGEIIVETTKQKKTFFESIEEMLTDREQLKTTEKPINTEANQHRKEKPKVVQQQQNNSKEIELETKLDTNYNADTFDFRNHEEARRAFIASVIFDRK